MHVTLFDYGVGNVHSLAKAIETAGARVIIEPDPSAVLDADTLVLPGVGAFAPAAERLAPAADALRTALAAGYPCLGICLGMQLLFESSAEGDGAGIGLLAGHVRRLRSRRTPHMGWNAVAATADPLFRALPALVAYFANSYVVDPAEPTAVIASTGHEHESFPAAVRSHNTWGVQFHPEKSGAAGLRVIRNFLDATAALPASSTVPVGRGA
ncbi:MAG: imidazole glycerol phosphate synthase subunit HisH [Longimicrobiales bacterium]